MPAKKTTSNTRKPQRGGAKKNSSGGDSKQLVRDVTGVVILCLGVLSVYFAFTPNAVGFPGVVRSIMTGLAGVLCFAIPIILCWAALILLFSTRQRRISPVRVALLSALIAIVFGVFELFAMDGLLADLRQTNYASFLLHAFRAQTGGGLIGAITVWPLYIGLGLHVAGSLIVYIALALIDLILLRKISMSRIRERAVDGLANVQQHMTQQREARAERREARFERREAERLIRAQEMVIPSVAPAGEQPKKAPNTAQDAFSAKETPVASKAAAKAPVVETVEPPTSARSTARPVREKPIVAEAPRRSAPVLPVREAQSSPTAPEDEPPFDPQDDLFDGRAQEPFPGAFAGARGAQKPAAKAQPEAFFKADEVVYETALHIADEEDDAPLDEEEDFILPSPEDFDAPEEAEAEYIPGSRLIEKEHVYKNEPAQPLSSYSAEKEMRAPIHTDMLLHEEEEAQDEPVDIPAAEPKSSSLFGDRLRRANAAYDAQKAAQSAPAEQSAPRSPMGSGLASGPENVPFSQNEIFGVHKSAAQAAPEPPPYNYPPVDLLAQAKPSKARNQEAIDLEKGRRLVEVLLSFGITTKLTGVSHGPTVTRFELAPAPGIKVSRITSLVDDIALGLAAKSVRIEAPIPGKPAVGVEVPNDEIETVQLRDVLESPEAQKHPSRIAAAIGRDNAGRNILCDLAKMPHILIAGATGAGKSVCINCIICSILYRATPEEVRLIMIDPKMVELSVYNEIPHLLVPVVTDPKKAAGALEWVVNEMTQRYRKFAASGTKDIKGYNLKRPEYEPAMPQIVVIIDELADLMMVAPGDVEDAICRIAQLARAAGIHLVIATQRPSVNVITGVIKANIPSRIAFTVASQVDSRTILDIGGAEKLLGRGDMLYAPSGTNKPQRVQGAWISENEVQAVVQYIRDRHEADYSEDLTEHLERADMSDAEKEEAEEQHDDLLPQAIEFVVEAGQASISMLQRKMRIGYARAGRLIDEMARRGFISEADGAKPREVLITREQFRAMFKE